MKTTINNLLLFTAIVLGSCATEPNDEIISFDTVKNSEYIRIEQKQTIVIREESKWRKFWKENVFATDSIGNTIAPENIDFQKDMVLGIFWGKGYSGCTNQANAIQRVERKNAKIVVRIEKISNLGPCRMIVFPLQVVKISKSDSEVILEGAQL